VRESFGALLAGWQATHAPDPAMRAVFTRIARDETRHAQFAWDVAAWLEARLDAHHTARLARERELAWDELCATWRAALPSEARAALGLPSPAEAARLIAALRGSLAAAA
jgi:hypothetical protein